MPKVTINNIEHEFPAGLNLIDACRQAGVEIPHFCYHPALSIAGNCRMCQVEVEMKGRRALSLACNTAVAEGMEVFTDTELVRETRRSVLEFLLLSHPIDCPICDDAGECKLQNYYMAYDFQPSRLADPKLRKHKAQDIGPNIKLDSERCVLCSRCVRFLREYAEKDQLGIFNSGANAELAPLPGQKLDNDYSGNVVDLCPVGALTDKSFRFKRRVWYLKKVDSICTGCSRGCNIEIQYDLSHDWKRNGSRILRLKPRHNPEVNEFWLCDAGRYGFEFIDSPDRLTAPLVRGEDGLAETDWDSALAEMAAALKKAATLSNRPKTALILAPQLFTGALYILKRLADRMGMANVDYRLPSVQPGPLDKQLQMRDRNPNSFAAEIIGLVPGEGGLTADEIMEGVKSGKIKNLLTVACDPAELLGEGGMEALKRLNFFGILHWTRVPSVEAAHFALPIATFAESNGVFINFEGRAQICRAAFAPRGEARPAWQAILLLGRAMGYKYKAFSDRELFEEFASKTDKFKELTWDEIDPLGTLGKS